MIMMMVGNGDDDEIMIMMLVHGIVTVIMMMMMVGNSDADREDRNQAMVQKILMIAAVLSDLNMSKAKC